MESPAKIRLGHKRIGTRVCKRSNDMSESANVNKAYNENQIIASIQCNIQNKEMKLSDIIKMMIETYGKDNIDKDIVRMNGV